MKSEEFLLPTFFDILRLVGFGITPHSYYYIFGENIKFNVYFENFDKNVCVNDLTALSNIDALYI